MKGTPPASGKVGERGDDAFEASRQAALEQLRQIVEGAKSDADREQLVQRIHRHRYGHKVESVPLAVLAERWDKRPSKQKAGTLQTKICHQILTRFVDFMHDHVPGASELGAITKEHVAAFLEKEEKRGVSARTWNRTRAVIRKAFKHLEPQSETYSKYLATLPTKDENTIHREPFTAEELKDVLAAAKDAPLIHKLIITAVCTAMRRGDVARLQWRSVDLKQGFVTVKTSKTGETVEIPILPLLREVLVTAKGNTRPALAGYVFPEAAKLITTSPDAIDRRLRQVLQRAGFVDAETAERVRKAEGKRASLPILTPETTRRRGLDALEKADLTEKRRERMQAIFTRYMDNQSVKQIAAGMASSVGIVSTRLNEVEQMIGAQVLRRPALPAIVRGSTIAEARADTQRIRRGSLKGWHSFRTTWITLALSAGVPMELVCRVTGHQTTDVVLKHYFRTGREEFRRTLQMAMPKLLSGGRSDPEKSPVEQAMNVARNMTAQTLKKDRKRILELLEAILPDA